jgi:hypothetical protein
MSTTEVVVEQILIGALVLVMIGLLRKVVAAAGPVDG